MHKRPPYCLPVLSRFLRLSTHAWWPYSFYVFLRIIVCLIAISSAAIAVKMNRITWAWIMTGVAIVFNPVLPLHMHRSDWKIFNLISAAIFVVWIVLASLGKPKPSQNSSV
jgi:hypothetical protein